MWSYQAFTPFTVIVPPSAGIRMPVRGLELNQETLTMDLLDGLSRMPPSPIERTRPVGAFQQLQLTLSKYVPIIPRAWKDVALTCADTV